jgi:hypothetical protein
MSAKMLAIVLCLLVVGMQQRLQDLYRFGACCRLVQVAAGGNAKLIAGCNIAAAGITHRSSPVGVGSGFGGQHFVEQLPRCGGLRFGNFLNGVTNMYEHVIARFEVFTLQHEETDVALDSASLTGAGELVDRCNFHWDGKAHFVSLAQAAAQIPGTLIIVVV